MDINIHCGIGNITVTVMGIFFKFMVKENSEIALQNITKFVGFCSK